MLQVYTFDIGGVSGHLNHISIFYAFARMSLKKRVPPCKYPQLIYVLLSTVTSSVSLICLGKK